MARRASYNDRIIEEFRANGGRVGGWEGTPLLLLTTTGARSGRARTNPLTYLRDGDRIAIFASKGGAPTHPDWYYNVRANPRVHVELGDEAFDADARIATGEERDRIWEEQKRRNRAFAEYEQKSGREIPVVVLSRSG